MVAANELARRIAICCSSAELRLLADEFDAKMATTKLGEDTLVKVWQFPEFEILFYFDQENKPKFVRFQAPVTELRAGDRLVIADELYEFAGRTWDQRDKCWLVAIKENPKAIRFGEHSLVTIERPV